uniref:hypothetical protein n=1 Tax=Psychrobacter sp. TB20-MNA-CIBAN-0197 TaxID=3140453 RepID=UPI003318CEDF
LNKSLFISLIKIVINIVSVLFGLDYIKSIGNTYSFMNNGNGSFSDFYIWREDFDERVVENNKFIEIKDKIGSLIANQ